VAKTRHFFRKFLVFCGSLNSSLGALLSNNSWFTEKKTNGEKIESKSILGIVNLRLPSTYFNHEKVIKWFAENQKESCEQINFVCKKWCKFCFKCQNDFFSLKFDQNYQISLKLNDENSFGPMKLLLSDHEDGFYICFETAWVYRYRTWILVSVNGL